MPLEISAPQSPSKKSLSPIIDVSWPSLIFDRKPANGASVTAAFYGLASHRGSPLPGVNTSANQIAGTGKAIWATNPLWQGRKGIYIDAGNAGASILIGSIEMSPNSVQMGNENDNSINSDDFRVKRFAALVAISSVGIEPTEVGIVFGTNDSNFQIKVGNAAGFGILADNAGKLNFFRRPTVGGATATDIVRNVSMADLGNWHLWELIAYGATPTQRAKVEVYIDSVLVGTWQFGIDAGLPMAFLGGDGSVGLGCALHARGAGSVMVVERLRYTVGPTLASVKNDG
jgi:hypothetical protein